MMSNLFAWFIVFAAGGVIAGVLAFFARELVMYIRRRRRVVPPPVPLGMPPVPGTFRMVDPYEKPCDIPFWEDAGHPWDDSHRSPSRHHRLRDDFRRLVQRRKAGA